MRHSLRRKDGRRVEDPTIPFSSATLSHRIEPTHLGSLGVLRLGGGGRRRRSHRCRWRGGHNRRCNVTVDLDIGLRGRRLCGVKRLRRGWLHDDGLQGERRHRARERKRRAERQLPNVVIQDESQIKRNSRAFSSSGDTYVWLRRHSGFLVRIRHGDRWRSGRSLRTIWVDRQVIRARLGQPSAHLGFRPARWERKEK